MTPNSTDSAEKSCKIVLGIDESIRFVGKIVDRKLLSFVRQKNSSPLLDEELEKMAHHQASVKVMMEEMFNESRCYKLDDHIQRKSEDDYSFFR